jgi:hypothetical protein
MNSTYFIRKSTGTHADPMAAVGLADLLAPAGDATIRDDTQRDQYTVTSAHGPELDTAVLGQYAGFLFLRPNEKTPPPKHLQPGEFYDYPRMKEVEKRSREAHKSKKGVAGEVAETIAAEEIHPEHYLYQTLNLLQGDGATNKACEWVRNKEKKAWQELLGGALRKLSKGELPEVDLDLDLVQLFSPQAAKGYARLKPDSTSRGDKTKDVWGEPFVEWLRFRGYFRAACTFGVGKDIRLMFPRPKAISLGALRDVVATLRKESIFGSSAKIDCLATLRLAQLLLKHTQGFAQHSPASLVSGMAVTHYQSLGSAKAVTGMEELAIPDWFPEGNARLWFDALQEHADRLRPLRDDNSDELGLLLQYRRFLQQRGDGATGCLLDFLESYGIYLLRQRGQNKWYHKQFQANHLEEILGNTSYKQILDNTGFLAVASALRSSTVSAQSQKRNKKDYRDIRYDILPELRRKRALPRPEQFLETIYGFLESYNAESAKRLEAGKSSGIKRVTTEELAQFASLFEQYPVNLVGAMLSAYATCREVRDFDDAEATPDQEGATE